LILLIDNYDSFTYNLADYLAQLHLEVTVKRNMVSDVELFSEEYEAVVLSPGPGIPEHSGKLLRIIDYYAGKKPILGICLGHQAIAVHFQGMVEKSKKPMHGKASIVHHHGDELFHDIPESFRVVRYHSLVCQQLPETLEVIAKTDDEIMAIRHKQLPVYGLQFHPEAYLTDFGLNILNNWKNICLGQN
jgi:anthranilate synthase/aminodeoxychorismate synthase-like glutamine amidotransferase